MPYNLLMNFRWIAIAALAKLGPAIVPEYITLLSSHNARERLYAINGLLRTGSTKENVVAVLTKALADKNKEVREAAQEALKKIKAEK